MCWVFLFAWIQHIHLIIPSDSSSEYYGIYVNNKSDTIGSKCNWLSYLSLPYTIQAVGGGGNTTYTLSQDNTVIWPPPHLIQARPCPFPYIIQPLADLPRDLFPSLDFTLWHTSQRALPPCCACVMLLVKCSVGIIFQSHDTFLQIFC